MRHTAYWFNTGIGSLLGIGWNLKHKYWYQDWKNQIGASLIAWHKRQGLGQVPLHKLPEVLRYCDKNAALSAFLLVGHWIICENGGEPTICQLLWGGGQCMTQQCFGHFLLSQWDAGPELPHQVYLYELFQTNKHFFTTILLCLVLACWVPKLQRALPLSKRVCPRSFVMHFFLISFLYRWKKWSLFVFMNCLTGQRFPTSDVNISLLQTCFIRFNKTSWIAPWLIKIMPSLLVWYRQHILQTFSVFCSHFWDNNNTKITTNNSNDNKKCFTTSESHASHKRRIKPTS